MYQSPELPVPPVMTVFPEKAKALWLKALDRPEADLKCKAADVIAQARRHGMKGLESAIDPLRAAMDQPDARPAVRLTAARALITLEAREAAPTLLRQAQAGGGDLRELVEPALARWDYRPARAVWLERLRDTAGPPRDLVLAVQALAAVGEAQAADPLVAVVRSERANAAVRLEAARALGALRAEGLEEEANRLAADTSPRGIPARLAAAALLARHRGEEAVRLLQRLAEDQEPAVAAVAVARLLEIDPGLVQPPVERLLASPDAKLRSLGAEVCARRPAEKHLRLLADRLDDVHPEVRVKARRALEAAAKKELRDAVLVEATRVLAARDKQKWRGLEQATILLTQLDHKPAAARLVELLTSDRPEVGLTAAWGLRRLAVAETLPGVTSYVEAALKHLPGFSTPGDPADFPGDVRDHQLSQLNQLLGQQKYEKADAVLRRFIPRLEGPMRPVLWPESRAAAVWALGLIHEGKPDAALAKELEARLNDIRRMPPEDDRVRRMAAVTLGRLKAKEALTSLQAFCPDHEPAADPVVTACGWAVEQITAKAMSPPKPIRKVWQDKILILQD
jgi:HEAT repeat protein